MSRKKGAGLFRKGVLPKLANFFRQLSLFDPVEETTVQNIPSRSINVSAKKNSLTFQSLCIGPYAHVEVILKPRMWESWRVKWTKRKESLLLEIPAHLEAAPEPIKLSLLKWAILVSKRRTKGDIESKLERQRLEKEIRAFLVAPQDVKDSVVHNRLQTRNRRRIERVETQGRFQDLALSFTRVNAEYFQNSLKATVTWSARLGGLSTHSLAQDGEGQAYHRISISRGYDNPDVTPEILDGVMYHECLHAAIPPEEKNGRRIVHGPAFRKREKAYVHFDAWRRWHRDGLPKSLRRMQRERK
jgi:hypothetical protein